MTHCWKSYATAHLFDKFIDLFDFFSAVARSCSPTKMKTDCQKAEAGGHTAEACYCDTDLCNNSSSVYVSIATGVMATLAVILSKVM